MGEALGGTLRGDEVIAMFGGLGMGKTAFVRGLARGMGIPAEEISSPTFAIVHEHHSGRCPLYHFDMYRIGGYDDLCSTGFLDYEGRGVIAVEWCENIENALQEHCLYISISVGGAKDERHIEIRGGDTLE